RDLQQCRRSAAAAWPSRPWRPAERLVHSLMVSLLPCVSPFGSSSIADFAAPVKARDIPHENDDLARFIGRSKSLSYKQLRESDRFRNWRSVMDKKGQPGNFFRAALG